MGKPNPLEDNNRALNLEPTISHARMWQEVSVALMGSAKDVVQEHVNHFFNRQTDTAEVAKLAFADSRYSAADDVYNT